MKKYLFKKGDVLEPNPGYSGLLTGFVVTDVRNDYYMGTSIYTHEMLYDDSWPKLFIETDFKLSRQSKFQKMLKEIYE